MSLDTLITETIKGERIAAGVGLTGMPPAGLTLANNSHLPA